ncbi:MAG: hypothetical protein KKA36_04620, partial [Gammaproteobacteria bacterium]|nr:hypothetical protein [Gammaproteobacteria bacterium]
MTMIFCSNTVPADSSLAAHKTFRQKVINFISALPFTILLGFGANVACANEWAIKEFEVVEVSPLNPWIIEQLATSVPSEFTGLADELAEVLRQLPVDMETWGATPPAGQEIMQGNLKITAYFLESMGFPEPKLEPVIDFGGQGKKYRIFLMTGFKVGGDEVAGVYNQ